MALKQYNYDKYTHLYDELELGGIGETKEKSRFLNKIFRRRMVSTVLDLTCGTGAKVIGLAKYGYKVTGSDITKGMLAIARKKARGLGIRFRQGDMTKVRLGKFDAVISTGNAMAHLEPPQFERAIKSAHANLKPAGTFVFDIFNLNYMLFGGYQNYEHLDHATTKKGTLLVRFNDNTFDRKRGVMRINQRTYIQEGLSKPTVIKQSWDMRLYTWDMLHSMLKDSGFKGSRSMVAQINHSNR